MTDDNTFDPGNMGDSTAAPVSEAPATTEAAPTEASPVAPTQVETVVDNLSAEEHMRFDPFATEPVVKPAAEAAPLATVPGAQPIPGATPAAPAPLSVEAQLAVIQSQLANPQPAAIPAATPTPVANQPAATATPAAPDAELSTIMEAYNNFQVPPQLLDAINSDEPQTQAQGLQAIMIGVARAVTQQLHGHFAPQLAGVDERVQTNIQSTIQAQSVFNDFYGAYPALNNPQLLPVVQATMQQMKLEPEFVNMQYGPQLRDALAARVAALLNTTPDGLRPQVGTVPRQPGGALINGNARPAGTNEPFSDPASTMFASLGADPMSTVRN